MVRTCLMCAAAILGMTTLSAGEEVVIPNHAPTTAGTGAYSTVLHPQPRSYQLVVGPSELGDLPAGAMITGIAWRRPTWIVYPDWPGIGATATFANFDISLSTSLNPPGSLSSTYTENIGPDVVQVRDGAFSPGGAFFPGGALTPAVNPFGQTLQFDQPYEYAGGDLLLTVRHTGNGSSNGFLDTVGSAATQAIGVSSYTQETEWYSQGLIVMKLTFDPPNETTPADINGDVVVDGIDLGILLANWSIPAGSPGCGGAPGGCAADINGDVVVDGIDLGILLAAWTLK